MEYSLLHVRATAESVDDALRTVATDWSGEVIAPQAHLGELWSTVAVTERAAASVAPLLSELLDTRVLAATVVGERFSLSYWQPGSSELRVDGRDDAATKELASALRADAGSLRSIVQSPNPPEERHAEAAKLLMLPLPLQASHQQPFDGTRTIQPSELPNRSSQLRGRRRLRRIYGALGVLELVAFLAVDYFWFLEPSILLVPALAVFIVNGVVLLLLRRTLRQQKEPSTP